MITKIIDQFILWFTICFALFSLRTIFNLLIYKKYKLAQNTRLHLTLALIMGALWVSWFRLCFINPIDIEFPDWIRFAGFITFLIGVYFSVYAFIKMKKLNHKDRLITEGLYSFLRNPMYIGFILWIVGFPIFIQNIAALATASIWTIHVYIWKITEENELLDKYPEYAQYKKTTWF